VRYLIRYESRMIFADTPVREHQGELRVVPRDDIGQTLHAFDLKIEPEAPLHFWHDTFRNRVAGFSVLPPHKHLVVKLSADVETLPHDPGSDEIVPPLREQKWIEEALRAQPRLLSFLLHRSGATPDISVLKEHGLSPPLPEAGQPVFDKVRSAMDWISASFRHDAGTAKRPGPLAALLKERAGDVHDLCHLLITVLRGWGIPARYVGGYRPLYSRMEDVRQAAAWGWVDALIPGAGWRGLDVVGRHDTDEHYIAVALGRDYGDAEPHRGVYKGASDKPSVPDVEVQMIPQQ
jgi:transglutaminase-like putative cysteine protease